MAITMKKSASSTSKAASSPKWYVRGDDTAHAVAEDDKRIEDKIASQNRMFRFYLKEDTSASITFVDGNLTPKGVLDCFMYREHQVYRDNKWTNWYPCVSEVEPCPICETGDEPSLVGVFTVIDHSEYKGKKNIYKDQPKLFVAKRTTLKMLQQLATKRGGLAGCTFDVTRSGENSPSVGNMFDFTEKNSIADLRKKYVRKTKEGKVETVFVPADYEEEIVFRSGDELRELGFGSSPIGSKKAPVDSEEASEDLEKEL